MPLGVLTLDQLLLGSSYSDAKEGAERSWPCICSWLMAGFLFHIPCSSCPFRRIRDSGGMRQRVCSQHLNISSFHPRKRASTRLSKQVRTDWSGYTGVLPGASQGAARFLEWSFGKHLLTVAIDSCYGFYELLRVCSIVTRLCQRKGLPGEDSRNVAACLNHCDSLVYCAETF